METGTLKVVCFSPTGTTKAIAGAVAAGMASERTEMIDITTPDARNRVLRTTEHDRLVVAVPVYMGRVPALIQEWLWTIQAERTPAVALVVYGNRAFDNALLELADIMTECGCHVAAGGAYIGEHSFSSPGIPTAEGRPDANDMRHAEQWGRKIREKLLCAGLQTPGLVNIPGQRPYGGVTELWSVDFIAVSEQCVQCGSCAERCPAGAIDPHDSRLIDTEKCITCCACIKNCRQQARTMKPGLVQEAAVRLNTLCREPKEPVTFP
ncbi:MAG TPA: EFR1 family ferrodoxin [Patescibacteria group bacterium]|nr:EFR1 family ferrodoxin [Patescibacteria group bacterium]